MKKYLIVTLLFLSATNHLSAQYFKYFTANQSIKLLNPAYVAGDSNIDVSINKIYAYQSQQNFGQTIIYSFGNEPNAIIALQNSSSINIEQGLFAKCFNLPKSIKSGIMLSYERERTDLYMRRNILGLSNAYQFKLGRGNLGIGYSLQVNLDRSDDINLKDNYGEVYGVYGIDRNYINHSLGLNYKSNNQKLDFGIAINNLFKSNYSSLPQATKNGPFNPMTFTYITVDNRRTLIANLRFEKSLNRQFKLNSDIRIGRIGKGIDEELPSFNTIVQVQSICSYKSIGLGLNYSTNNSNDQLLGFNFQYKIKGLQLMYSYRLTPTKILTVSSGTHEFGIRYKL